GSELGAKKGLSGPNFSLEACAGRVLKPMTTAAARIRVFMVNSVIVGRPNLVPLCSRGLRPAIVGATTGRYGEVSASRVAFSVWISDSFGSLRIIGSITHPSPVGMSRVREIARHSTYTPSS